MPLQINFQKFLHDKRFMPKNQAIISLLGMTIIFHCVIGHSLLDTKRLKKELLKDKYYDVKVRPSLNQSKPTEVNIHMVITNINSLDIISGKLLSPGYLVATWTDEQLIWNSSDFNDLKELSLSSDEIWCPSLIQVDATDEDFNKGPLWVDSNGTVSWILAGLFEALCKLDVLHFPFDKHVCTFKILPEASEVQLKVSSVNNYSEAPFEHGEWEVKNSLQSIEKFTEPISGKTFVTLLNTLTISRRYMFKAVHTCLPLLLLGCLNIFVFMVPLRSGERVSFSTTILLNFVLLTSSISEDIPHNSLELPYLSIFMTITNINTTIGVIFSVMLCRMDLETVVPVPESLKKIAFRYIAFRSGKTTCKPDKSKTSPDTNDQDEISNTENTFTEEENTTNITKVDITWSVVAELIDKCLFIFNIINVVVISIVFTSLTVAC